MKSTWVRKTEFNPLFVSQCTMNKEYMATRWTSINDLAEPIVIKQPERNKIVKFVIDELVKEYPEIINLKYRNGVDSALKYFESAALNGILPSLTESINKNFDYMILTILKESVMNIEKWKPTLKEYIHAFKDCQQV